MGNKIIRFIGRHGLVIALFLVVVAAVAGFGQQPHTQPLAAVTPTQVIVKQAAVTDQGVQLAWLESQAGAHPISGYVIERSRGNGSFERIARLEPLFLDYLDADGRAGDTYRVIAEDSGQPAAQSPPSEPLAAVPPKSGSTIALAPALPQVLSASTAVGQAGTPEAKAAMLQDLIAQTFTVLDKALATKDITSAKNHLNTLQHYQRQILTLWPQLSSAQKTSVAQTCVNHMDIFETNVHILPEDDQFDGMLVHAGCDALQEQTE